MKTRTKLESPMNEKHSRKWCKLIIAVGTVGVHGKNIRLKEGLQKGPSATVAIIFEGN